MEMFSAVALLPLSRFFKPLPLSGPTSSELAFIIDFFHIFCSLYI